MTRSGPASPLEPGEGFLPMAGSRVLDGRRREPSDRPAGRGGGRPAPSPRLLRGVRAPTRRLLVGLALLAAAAGCREEGTAPTAAPDLLAMDADQVVIGMEHLVTHDGLRRAFLRADTAWFLEDSTLVRLRPVEVSFFGAGGGEVSDLTAREGVYDMRTSDMRALGRVVVRSRLEFQRLETERLSYDAEADLLRTDTAFVLYKEDSRITGDALVSDPALDSTQVSRPAAVVGNPGETR